MEQVGQSKSRKYDNRELIQGAKDSIFGIIEGLRVCGMRRDSSLALGAAGRGLMWSEIFTIAEDDFAYSEAVRYAKALQRRLAGKGMHPNLFGGVLGVLYALEKIAGNLGVADLLEAVEEGYEALADGYMSYLKSQDCHFDLVNGIVGILAAYTTGYLSPSKLAVIGAAQEELVRRHTELDCMQGWVTSPAWVAWPVAGDFPTGYLDLGLAHGNAGVIAIAGRAKRLGVALTAFLDRARSTAFWIAEHTQLTDEVSAYPNFYHPGSRSTASRVGWCYGDLSLGFALARFGASCNELALTEIGERLACRSGERLSTDGGLVNESSLCHGAAGIVQIYSRLYQVTAEEIYNTYRRAWLTRLLDVRRGARYGGYYTYQKRGFRVEAPVRMVRDTGLLNGVAGVVLALLEFTETTTSHWDDFMLLD